MDPGLQLVPVEYDPFGENPSAPQLVPIDHDPSQPAPDLSRFETRALGVPGYGAASTALGAVAPSLRDYLTKTPPRFDPNAVNAAGKYPSIENPYAGPAGVDTAFLGATALAPELAGGRMAGAAEGLAGRLRGFLGARGGADLAPAGNRLADTVPPLTADPEADRLARSQQMGFTTPAYRGATRPEPQEPQVVRGKPSVSWSSNSPDLANAYAGGDQPYGDNPRVFAPGRGWSPLSGQVQPLLLNTSDYHVVDAGGKGISQVRGPALFDAHLRARPGVVIKNVYDEPGEGGGSASGSQLGKPSDVYATFDPATRRSKFAKFDPSKKLSRDLLAGLAPFGIAAPALSEANLSDNNQR